ncbi:MAG: GNAT family N-acetyltransferase [Actinomycetota bacterium]
MTDPTDRLRPATADDLAAIGRVHAVAARLAYANIFPADATPPTPEALAGGWATLLADPHPLADVLVATGPRRPAESGPASEIEHDAVVGAEPVGPNDDVVGAVPVGPNDDVVGAVAVGPNDAVVGAVAVGPNDAVVGAVAVGPNDDVPTGLLLHRLYVDPGCQGRGLGVALHDLALARAARRGATAINLWVLEANATARSLYERHGWCLVPGPTLANEPPSIVDVLYERQLEPGPAAASEAIDRA